MEIESILSNRRLSPALNRQSVWLVAPKPINPHRHLPSPNINNLSPPFSNPKITPFTFTILSHPTPLPNLPRRQEQNEVGRARTRWLQRGENAVGDLWEINSMVGGQALPPWSPTSLALAPLSCRALSGGRWVLSGWEGGPFRLGMGWEIDLLGSEDVGAEGATKLSGGVPLQTRCWRYGPD